MKDPLWNKTRPTIFKRSVYSVVIVYFYGYVLNNLFGCNYARREDDARGIRRTEDLSVIISIQIDSVGEWTAEIKYGVCRSVIRGQVIA